MSTVVIGAGLAALFAARTLAAAGEDVTVLEAGAHLGGRMRTDREVLRYGAVADLGASFLDIGQDVLLQFCLDHEIALTPRMQMFPQGPGGAYTGSSILRGNLALEGERVAETRQVALASHIEEALAESPPQEVETVLAWARRSGLSQEARDAYLAQTGFNPLSRHEFVSSWHVHPGDIGRQCWLLRDGTDTIAHTAAQGLDVRLDTPVRLVSRSGRRYSVHTDTETFTADYVVVTPSVHATRKIGFDPVLPDWKLRALLGTPMAQGGKVVAQYAEGSEIVEAAGPSTLTDSAASMIWLKAGPNDTVIALSTFPDRGDGLLADPEAALSVLDAQIEIMCGFRPQRVAGTLQDWTSDPYVGGVVNLQTGGLSRRAALAAPVSGIHFAGEATADEWASAMEGAARSGLRAASEILEKSRTRRPSAMTGA